MLNPFHCIKTRFTASVSLPPTQSKFSDEKPRSFKAISSDEIPAQSENTRRRPSGVLAGALLFLCSLTQARKAATWSSSSRLERSLATHCFLCFFAAETMAGTGCESLYYKFKCSKGEEKRLDGCCFWIRFKVLKLVAKGYHVYSYLDLLFFFIWNQNGCHSESPNSLTFQKLHGTGLGPREGASKLLAPSRIPGPAPVRESIVGNRERMLTFSICYYPLAFC